MSAGMIWPECARCAVVITVNYDGESVERSERPDGALWGRYSYGRYGVQTGVPRILDLLSRHSIRATFFVPAWDAERDPDVVREIRDAGHEIAAHGYLHEDFSAMTPDEQRATLARSESVFEDTLGIRPLGWRAPRGLMTSETRPILAERGYRYDSSFCDDDFPYLAETESGQRLVEVPVFQTASDSHYYRLRRSPAIVEQAWKTEFAAIYREGALLNLTVHPRGDVGSGRLVRLRAVESLLDTIREYPGVWMTTCGELVEWALDPSTNGIEIWPA